MAGTFQVIALSSVDPDGRNRAREPKLPFSEALVAAGELKAQGKAFRLFVEGAHTPEEIQSFRDLGALV